MLRALVESNRDELVRRCLAKAEERLPERPGFHDEVGVTARLHRLVERLRDDEDAKPRTSGPVQVLPTGTTLEHVLLDYQDVCEAVTVMANVHDVPVTPNDYAAFDRCLDDAIADAVTALGEAAALGPAPDGAPADALTRDLRRASSVAAFAFEAIKTGHAAATGATGALLERSLGDMHDLAARALSTSRNEDGRSNRSGFYSRVVNVR